MHGSFSFRAILLRKEAIVMSKKLVFWLHIIFLIIQLLELIQIQNSNHALIMVVININL